MVEPDHSSRSAPKPVRRVLSFFDSTTKILVAVGGLIAAVTALIAGVHALQGPKPTPSSSVDANSVAVRVSQCESTHGMSQQSQMKTLSNNTFSFESCSWPPASHADSDGHLTISMSVDNGPDQS